MRFLSVCSGIEAASVAWNPLGWKAVAFSEIEPFPCAVLAHHYPDTPNWGDMTKHKEWPDVPIDLLCGGPPASLSASQDSEKDWMTRVATSCSPLVPLLQSIAPSGWYGRTSPASCRATKGGILAPSSGCWANSGMGSPTEFLTLSSLEYPSDAVVCSLSDVLETGEVPQRFFFERHGLSGNPPPSRQARKRIAPTLSARAQGGGGLGTDFDCDGGLVAKCLVRDSGGGQRYDAESETLIAHTLLGKHNSSHAADQDTYITHSLRGEGFDASEDGTGRGTPLIPIGFLPRTNATKCDS